MFSRSALEAAISDGLVVRREHPTEPLAILNYTARCQYERGLWSPVTTQCRGLIYNTESDEVAGRPFRKFFNYGQAEAEPLDLMAPAVVSDKMDGSLGILYPVRDGWAVATRGSFEGEQAVHATDLWWSKYANYEPPPGYTLLFEIIYPGNRIVVDYGETDDLYLLGAVEIATGRVITRNNTLLNDWPGPWAAVFPYVTLAEALAAPPRPNCEGLVVCVGTDMVKIKQEDYVRLHRIVTGLNERTVWEHLSEGKPLEELLEPLPDEFHAWTREVGERLLARVASERHEIEGTFAALMNALPDGYTRKDFALAVQDHPLKWALFSRLSGKDYVPGLWDNAKPEAHLSPRRAQTEDAA